MVMAAGADKHRNDEDWIDTCVAPRKRSSCYLRDITNRGRRPPIASKRITRSTSRVNGSTNDNAIAIDSSSDESDDEDIISDGCLIPTDEAEDDVVILQENQAQPMRATETSWGNEKILPEPLNNLLFVYPFEVERETLRAISSEFTELGGDQLGIAEVGIEAYDTDVNQEDGREDAANERFLVQNAYLRRQFLSITEADKDRLESGQLLNDTLVDLWMSWISRQHISTNESNQVHFFSSHFFSTIEEKGAQGVASWTISKKKRVDVFQKKFIFVPVNSDLHWSLCVIVNAGLIGGKAQHDSSDTDSEEEWPCILFFDSLKMHRKRHIAKRMREWLNFEWNRIEHKPKRLQNPFTAYTMKLVTPKGKLFRCMRLLLYGTSYSSALKLPIDCYQFHIRTMGLIAEYLSADTHTVCTSCAIKPFPLRGCVITFRS